MYVVQYIHIWWRAVITRAFLHKGTVLQTNRCNNMESSLRMNTKSKMHPTEIRLGRGQLRFVNNALPLSPKQWQFFKNFSTYVLTQIRIVSQIIHIITKGPATPTASIAATWCIDPLQILFWGMTGSVSPGKITCLVIIMLIMLFYRVIDHTLFHNFRRALTSLNLVY